MSRDVCPSCGSSSALGAVHCFKCGYISAYNNTGELFSVVQKQETSQVLQLRTGVILDPKQFSTPALRWLYKAGVYDEVIVKQRIAYCPDIDKVLIPAFNNGELIFYQLRSLDEDAVVKYVTYGSTSQNTIIYNDHKGSKTIVICEDHLSGIRLRPSHNVMCLSGTSIKNNIIEELLANYSTFIFWLDPDQPGREALYKNYKKLKWYADKNSVKNMFLSKNIVEYVFKKVNYQKIVEDPKYYLDNEIVHILEEELIEL